MLWITLIGCDGKDGEVVEPPTPTTTSSTDPQTTPPPTTTPVDSADSAVDTGAVACDPVSIDVLAVTCDDQEYVTFSMDTLGEVPLQGMVFAMETANYPPWSEEHDLWLREDDVCAATFEMRVISQSNPSAPFYERNVASLFSCGAHFESDGVMTYAFAVYTDQGFAGCVVAGADPEGLRDGAYDALMINIPSFDLSTCAVGAL
jgi:hypothetical protein